MDTKRVLTPTLFQFAQEDDLAFHLFDGDVVVLDALEVLLHLVQFMVVSGKERTSLSLGMFVQILYDSPGNTDTVISASTSS